MTEIEDTNEDVAAAMQAELDDEFGADADCMFGDDESLTTTGGAGTS